MLHNVRKVFFGDGVAYDLASLHQFEKIHRIAHENRQDIRALLQQADLFVNVMDFPLISLAKEIECPCVLVDSLLWFWPELPEEARYADLYLCQEFFGLVRAKIQEYQLKNARLIGPMVSSKFQKLEKKNQVIINFGGIENPRVEIGKNSNYPPIMLKILLPILTKNFDHILVTGRSRVMQMMQKFFPSNKQVRFEMLTPQEMLGELSCSEALFTAPGIQTIYDAYDKLPIFCLPPQNNSNVRNLNLFKDNAAVQYCLQWDELYTFPFEQCKGNEKAEFELLLNILRNFEKSKKKQAMLETKIKSFQCTLFEYFSCSAV